MPKFQSRIYNSLAWLLAFVIPLGALADPDATLWNDIVADFLKKASERPELRTACPNIENCLRALASIPEKQRMHLSVQEIFNHLSVSGTQQKELLDWLERKYGVQPGPVFRKLHALPSESVKDLRFRPVLPGFTPGVSSSLSDLAQYVDRKWAPLKSLHPEQLVFSEFNGPDTLSALRNSGFMEVYKVNGAYLGRGMSTYLAIGQTPAENRLYFGDFSSRSLSQHTQLIAAHAFGEDVKKARTLIAPSEKSSWAALKSKLNSELRLFFKSGKIQDLVIGYPESVAEHALAGTGIQRIEPSYHGEYFDLEIYEINGKTLRARRVGLLRSKGSFRYFGDAATTLVESLLDRGVERVIFAGSAGALSRDLPLNTMITPRSFYIPGEPLPGESTTLQNDLFNLVPKAPGYDQKHFSIPSPLLENQETIRALRNRGITSIDVEAGEIAKTIKKYNAKTRRTVRFASAFIVTDHPWTSDQPRPSHGLHIPRSEGKDAAKVKFTEALRDLWDLPGAPEDAGQTTLIAQHFRSRIDSAAKDPVILTALRNEISDRILQLDSQQKTGMRVSRGLSQRLFPLVGEIDQRLGILPQPGMPQNAQKRVKPVGNKVTADQARALMRYSLSRSSTLNSGDALRITGKSLEENRRLAIAALENGIRMIEEKRTGAFSFDDLKWLHGLVNSSILPQESHGTLQNFEYLEESGRKKSSYEAVTEYLEWYNKTPATPETALEAYLRFEHIHPFEDGNGRVAELLSHRIALKGDFQPLVLPQRFDIDYILALGRNGPTPTHLNGFLDQVVTQSNLISDWFASLSEKDRIRESFIDPKSGRLALRTADGKSFTVLDAHLAPQGVSLEREQRLTFKTEKELNDFRIKLQSDGAAIAESPPLKRNQYTTKLYLVPSQNGICESLFLQLLGAAN